MTGRIGGGLRVAGVSKQVSRLVLGTAFYKLADKEQWFTLMDRFRELGGTTIDSAHGYGESEKVVGAWLGSRKISAEMLVITKCAHGKAILPAEDFEKVVDDEVAQSHRDLGVEVIDVLFLHRDNPAVGVERIMSKLASVVKSGHARSIGASNWTYDRIDAANAWAARHGVPFAVVSNNISLARPTEPFYPNLVSPDAAGEAWHTRTGTPLVPWSSQARGFFTGRWPREMRDKPEAKLDGFNSRMIAVYATDANYERYARAQSLGRDKGGSSAMQIALAWVLARPFPTAPVIGPHSIEELESCVEAQRIELSPKECRWLDLEE
jgi:aryl-alcohol dehydrogenase-like predicted oxidoreductase